MHLACPHCNNRIETDETLIGEVVCPSCGSSFRLEKEPVAGGTIDGNATVDEAGHVNAGLTTAWDATRPLSRLGKFLLLETVGVGSFGTVYRARDPELDRVVAIKVPRSGNLPSGLDRQRFLREARSVARLRHPAIVPLYEVGQDGELPYLVSEFVHGTTLADRIGRQRPSPPEAALLIADIADALQYAHERGVIHRDVKPTNILLDADGKPHLMDFGMAKRDAGEVTMTVDGQILGTPAYMSPEQARGDAHKVDGRSDVYSLGVILYQLLTGELPFRGAARMVIYQVLHDDPRAPRRLNDRVPRDLETICLKAMAKDPQRRYASAGNLADDLRRFCRGEPIHARPIGRVEKLWRWCRRDPMAAGLIVALILVFVAGFIGVVWQWRRAEAHLRAASDLARREAVERQNAEANRDKARLAVERFFSQVSENQLLNIPGLQPLRQELLEDAVDFYQGLIEHQPNDLRLQAELAGTFLHLAVVYHVIDRQEKAVESLQKGLDIAERLRTEYPDDRELHCRLAGFWRGIRRLHRASKPAFGPLEILQGLRALQRAAALWGEFVADNPTVPGFRRDLAGLSILLAELQWHIGLRGTAGPPARKAREILESLLSENSQQGYRADLAHVYSVVGYMSTGEDSAQHFRRSVQLLEQLTVEFPDVPIYRDELAISYRYLSNRLGRAHAREAEQTCRRAIELSQALVDDFPFAPTYRESLAHGYDSLAMLYSEMARPRDAEKAYREAILVKEKLASDFRRVPRYREELARSHYTLGDLLRHHASEQQHAEASYRQGMILSEKLAAEFSSVPDYRLLLTQSCRGVAATLEREPSRAKETVQLYRRALSLNDGLAAEFPKNADYQCDLALTLCEFVRFMHTRPTELEEAHRLASRAVRQLQIAASLNPRNHHLKEWQKHLGKLERSSNRGG